LFACPVRIHVRFGWIERIPAGHWRIQGQLINFGHGIGESAIRRILTVAGLGSVSRESAQDRQLIEINSGAGSEEGLGPRIRREMTDDGAASPRRSG
jgi:hypothetical protein